MIFKFLFERIFFIFLFILDFSIWLLLQILPNKIIFRILSLDNNFLRININNSRKMILLKKSRICLKKRSSFGNYLSSCLSRSITGKAFLSIFGINCNLHLCMIKKTDGTKIAHSWLEAPDFKFKITGDLISDQIKSLYIF